MFCENCGQSLPEGSRFCDSCGGSVSELAAPISHMNAPSAPLPDHGTPNPPTFGATPSTAQKKTFRVLPILLTAVLAVGAGAAVLLVPRFTRGGSLVDELRDLPPQASPVVPQTDTSDALPTPSSSADANPPEAQPKAKSDADLPGAQPENRPEAQVEAQPEGRSEMRPEDQLEAQPETDSGEPDAAQAQETTASSEPASATARPWENPGYDPTADIAMFDWVSALTTVPPEGASKLSELSQMTGLWRALRIDPQNNMTWMEVNIAAYDEREHGGSGMTGNTVVTMASYYTTDGPAIKVTPPEKMYSAAEASFLDGEIIVAPGSGYEWHCVLWEIGGAKFGVMESGGNDLILLMR